MSEVRDDSVDGFGGTRLRTDGLASLLGLGAR